MKSICQDPAHPIGQQVTVKTYAGPTIRCRVLEIRRLAAGIAYTVLPLEDKERELRAAGVPKGNEGPFIAFDCQIQEQPIQPVGDPITKGISSPIIRRKGSQQLTSACDR